MSPCDSSFFRLEYMLLYEKGGISYERDIKRDYQMADYNGHCRLNYLDHIKLVQIYQEQGRGFLTGPLTFCFNLG